MFRLRLRQLRDVPATPDGLHEVALDTPVKFAEANRIDTIQRIWRISIMGTLRNSKRGAGGHLGGDRHRSVLMLLTLPMMVALK